VYLQASSRGANAARLSCFVLKQRFRRLFRFQGLLTADQRAMAARKQRQQEIACAFSWPPGRYMRVMHHRKTQFASELAPSGRIGIADDIDRSGHSPIPPGWPDTNLGRSESCALFIWSAGVPPRCGGNQPQTPPRGWMLGSPTEQRPLSQRYTRADYFSWCNAALHFGPDSTFWNKSHEESFLVVIIFCPAGG
jgi:hypothetical protein